MMHVRDALWFAAGLLTALAASFVLQPWLPQIGKPLAMRTLKWSALGVLIVAVPVLILYAWRGNSDRISAASVADVSPTNLSTATAEGHGPDSLDIMLARLERRLRSGGGTAADWELLAQTYDFLGRTADASTARNRHEVASATAAAGDAGGGRWPTDLVAEVMDLSNSAPTAGIPGSEADVAPAVVQPAASAKTRRRAQQLLSAADQARTTRNFAAAKSSYDQLVALGQMSAQSWADYADVTASLNGGKLDGPPQRYIEMALRLDPTNEKALWLKASAEHDDQHYALAVSTWTQLLARMPAGSTDAKIFAANLAEDQRLAGTAAGAGAGSEQNAVIAIGAAPQAGAAPVQVIGEVTLAESLKSKVPAGLTLFIVAKSINSPGAPVAVVRTQTGQWPLKFRLDDSLSMLPERKLSTAGPITVEARVSQGGTAASQAGDLQSAPASVDPRSGKSVHLVIDHVIG